MSQLSSLKEIRQFFAADRFATEVTGAEIRLAEPGRSVCALALTPRHRNAAGTPQGGAIFTLADFAFAVAANGYTEKITISLQHDITYLAPAKGKILLAEARRVKDGRTAGFYTVDVTDELGTHVAYMTVNGFVVGTREG